MTDHTVATHPALTAHEASALSPVIAVAFPDAEPRECMAYRFGLWGYDHHTVGECSQRFGYDREEMRSMEAKVLSMVRHPAGRPAGEIHT